MFMFDLIYFFGLGLYQFFFFVVPNAVYYVCQTLLILFGLALFTVPPADDFRRWLQQNIENGADAYNVNFITRRLANWLQEPVQTRFYNLGCCRMVSCRFPGQDAETHFLGIFRTWIPLN